MHRVAESYLIGPESFTPEQRCGTGGDELDKDTAREVRINKFVAAAAIKH